MNGSNRNKDLPQLPSVFSDYSDSPNSVSTGSGQGLDKIPSSSAGSAAVSSNLKGLNIPDIDFSIYEKGTISRQNFPLVPEDVSSSGGISKISNYNSNESNNSSYQMSHNDSTNLNIGTPDYKSNSSYIHQSPYSNSSYGDASLNSLDNNYSPSSMNKRSPINTEYLGNSTENSPKPIKNNDTSTYNRGMSKSSK